MGRYVINTSDEQDAALAWHVDKGMTTADAMVQSAVSEALAVYVSAYLTSAKDDVGAAFLDAPQAVRDTVIKNLNLATRRRG